MAIKYRLLSYTVDRDWRHWVCAVNATKSAVCLRFLWGVLLDDPLGRPAAGHVDPHDLGLPARGRHRYSGCSDLRARGAGHARPLPRERRDDQRRRPRALREALMMQVT